MEEITILIVEDEAVMAVEMIGMLKKQGCGFCERAETGEAALEYLEHNETGCVLMDIVLSGTLDGVETAKIIKTKYDIPVIFITAHADENDMKRALETGPYGFIHKPVRDYELVYVIKTAMQHYHAEKGLRESEEMFRMFFDRLKNPVSIVDMQFNILMMNNRAVACLNMGKEELSGKSLKEVLPDLYDNIRENIDKQGGPGSPFQFESLLRISGEDLWFLSTVDFLKEKVMGREAVQIVSYDITSRKKYEENIRKSLVEKELLLKEIHHRVKNNMQIISSLLDLQYGRIVNIRDRELFLNSQNRVRAMALVHEKLYKSDNISSIEFRDYVEGLINEYRETLSSMMKNIVIHVESEDISLDINEAIPCAIILNELITNSLKHAFPGGMRGRIEIFFRRSVRGKYELTVSDDGVGLPDDFSLSITDALGLKLVNVLTEQIKGSFSINRQNGTVIRIIFGSSSAREDSIDVTEHEEEPGVDKKRILIVEDERITAIHIKGLLEKAGYHVTGMVAAGGMVPDALEGGRPDLILMDIFLEDGKDGITVVEEMKGNYEIPVIYTTANTDEHVMKRAQATGPVGYIDKPIDKVDLINAIEKALGE